MINVKYPVAKLHFFSIGDNGLYLKKEWIIFLILIAFYKK